MRHDQTDLDIAAILHVEAEHVSARRKVGRAQLWSQAVRTGGLAVAVLLVSKSAVHEPLLRALRSRPTLMLQQFSAINPNVSDTSRHLHSSRAHVATDDIRSTETPPSRHLGLNPPSAEHLPKRYATDHNRGTSAGSHSQHYALGRSSPHTNGIQLARKGPAIEIDRGQAHPNDLTKVVYQTSRSPIQLARSERTEALDAIWALRQK